MLCIYSLDSFTSFRNPEAWMVTTVCVKACYWAQRSAWWVIAPPHDKDSTKHQANFDLGLSHFENSSLFEWVVSVALREEEVFRDYHHHALSILFALSESELHPTHAANMLLASTSLLHIVSVSDLCKENLYVKILAMMARFNTMTMGTVMLYDTKLMNLLDEMKFCPSPVLSRHAN